MTERTVTLGDDCTVAIKRTYATTVEDLWDACTNPERIPRWFLPVTGDLRVGGRFQLEGHAGGSIEACDPPNGFRITWEHGGKVSRVELRLTADGNETALELVHSGQVADDFWQQFGPGATGLGWDLALVSGLERHVASGASVDPAAAMAWTGSEEGRAFIADCSAAWRDAHVVAGATPEDAAAAAAATLAAYTA
jgi:uncharacterized protein YndB with AHSA1/START domain